MSKILTSASSGVLGQYIGYFGAYPSTPMALEEVPSSFQCEQEDQADEKCRRAFILAIRACTSTSSAKGPNMSLSQEQSFQYYASISHCGL
jgi:hypothetical protein